MPERPTGTVTFLFTDIEGSTRLLQELREGYAEVLSGHARLIRSAIEEFGGHEIDTQGDAFFVAFARARDAVGAAVALQRALASEPWPDGVSLRVRMGIHTGEPLVGGERYVGMGVNRGARICAAGHGGQVLLSNATRELVEDDLPDDVRVVDLGEHELKDLKRPERIFQLEIDGLPSSFPPLRTAKGSTFEGREEDLARAADQVARRRLDRRLLVLAFAGGVVIVASLVGALKHFDSSETAVAVNSIVALDASGSIEATVPVGARPVAIASGAGSLWVANLDDKSVTRVDAASRQAVRNIAMGATPTGLAATGDVIWVADGRGNVSKIDPRYDRPTSKHAVAPPGAFFGRGATIARPMIAAFGSIWIVHPDGVVLRIHPDSARPTGSVGVGNSPSAIAAGAGSLWVTNGADGTVTRIDPTTLGVTTTPVGHGPAAVAVNAAGAWVANAGDNTVVRIDPETNAVGGMTPVGDGPTALIATDTAVWVANSRDGTVMRLDPESGDAVGTIRLGGTPTAFASAADGVWVAVAAAAPAPATVGGVARLTAAEGFTTLDPALGVAPQVQFATCANLVTYPDKPAPEGSRIVPEVAEAVPVPTDGGRTYRFRIRPGFRFSPPSNEPVTAKTFQSTIERVTSPHSKSQIAHSLSGIAGYEDYIAGEAAELSGVAARGRTLTIRLSRPDGGFLATLAGGAACAVPPRTPADPDGIDSIPAAGPYYIASYVPRQQLVLRRNPNYHGERPRHLDEIVIAIGIESSRALKGIEEGEYDYSLEGPPRDAGPRLAAKYGSGSDAAKAGVRQYFVSEAVGGRFLHMNASRPIFSRTRLRRAVNYAIDRRALVAQGRRFAEVNPFNAGTATDDYLSPATTGAKDFRLYPLNGPDVRRARRLAGRMQATAVMYTPNLSPWREEAEIVRRNLEPLGIEVVIKEFAIGDFFTRIFRRGEPFDLAVSGYSFGSTDPGALLGIFSGDAIAQNQSISYLDDPAFDRKLRSAAKLSGAKRYREHNRLAFELARDLAPAAAFATTASRDFFSARIGCQVYQPVFGMDLAALCLRE